MPPTQPPAQPPAKPPTDIPAQTPASLHAPPAAQSRVDTDHAARKRQEIGLTPRRATAQQAVARPPDAQILGPLQKWLVVAIVAAVAVITLALIAAQLSGDPTDATSVGQTIVAALDNPAGLLEGAAFQPVDESFDGEESLLVRDFQSRRWSMGTVGGLYRIRMWPGVIAWSTLGQGELSNFRLSTSMTVSLDTPKGYGGLIARYSDDDNLYLFEVDGDGRFRLIARKDGEWAAIQDWALHPALKPAGMVNELVLEDRTGAAGSTVSIFANGQALITTDAIDLPAGDAGVVAGSLDPAVAEANFDWLKLVPLE